MTFSVLRSADLTNPRGCRYLHQHSIWMETQGVSFWWVISSLRWRQRIRKLKQTPTPGKKPPQRRVLLVGCCRAGRWRTRCGGQRDFSVSRSGASTPGRIPRACGPASGSAPRAILRSIAARVCMRWRRRRRRRPEARPRPCRRLHATWRGRLQQLQQQRCRNLA